MLLQAEAQEQPASKLHHTYSAGNGTMVERFQAPHLSKGQRFRLQQWTLRVSNGSAFSDFACNTDQHYCQFVALVWPYSVMPV